MSFVNNALMKVAFLPKGTYAKIGVDLGQLKTILTTKLIMDDRRPMPMQQIRNKETAKKMTSATIFTMLFSAFIGLLFLVVFALDISLLAQMTIYFTTFIAMLSLTLISDFTSVLIDVRDNYIILPKPVNDKTFVVARLLHILIHITKIVFPLYLPCVIYLAIAEGFFACLIFVILILFTTLISVFLINAFYIFVLKVTTPEKFRNVIAYIQIFFSIIFYVGFRGSSFVMEKIEVHSAHMFESVWWILSPPFWFGSAFNLIYTGQGTTIHYIATVLAFIAPVITIYIVIKYLAPSFNRKLSLISGSGSSAISTTEQKETPHKRSFADRISSILTSNNQEEAGFLFTWKMMSRTREFKMRVYPGLGYIIFLFGFFIYKAITKSDDDQSFFHGGFQFIMGVYAIAIITTSVIRQINFSDNFEAGWIFYTSPVHNAGQILSGALKAAIWKFGTLLFLLIAILGISLEGTHIIPDLILALLNVIVISYLTIYLSKKHLPFSQPLNIMNQGMQIRIMFLMVLISGVIGVGHYFVFDKIYIVLIGCFFLAIIGYFLSQSIKETEWSKFT